MAAPLKVGVAGLGKVAQLHHLPALQEIEGIRVAAVCDLSAQLGHFLAGQLGLPRSAVVQHHAGLLDRGLDAIVIATGHHGPILRDALTAGLPVFVEKPCTWGLGEANELTELAGAVGLPVQVGYVRQHDPAVTWLRDQLDEVPYYIRAHNFAGGRHRWERVHQVRKPGSEISASLAAEDTAVDRVIAGDLGDDHPRRIAALRTLALLGIHGLNLVTSLLGEPRAGRLTWHETPLGVCYLITLRYQRGQCMLEVLADFNSSRDWDEQVTCYTSLGQVELAFASPFLRHAPTAIRRRHAAGTEVHEEQLIVSRQSAFVRQLVHFRDVLRGEREPMMPMSAARDDLALLYRLVREMEV
jgi:predicted dehydrogenase